MILIADPVLIFGLWVFPEMDINGAALASVLGFAAGLVLAVAFVLRGRSGGVMSRRTTRVGLNEFRALYDRGSHRPLNRRTAASQNS